MSAKMLKEFLLSNYYQAICSSNSLETFKIIQENKIDILLLDLLPDQIEDKSLFDLLDNEKNAAINIILLTNTTTEQNKFEFLSKGVDCILDKPLNFDELLIKIRILLQNKKQIDDLKYLSDKNILYSQNEAVRQLLASLSILIISEDEDFLNSYNSLLKELNVTVLLAKDKEEAIKLFLEHQPELCLLNNQFKQCDPLDIFSYLNNIDQNDAIFLLALDQYDNDLVDRIIDLGFNDYLLTNYFEQEFRHIIYKKLLYKASQDFLKSFIYKREKLAFRDDLTGLFNQKYFKHYEQFYNNDNKIYLIVCDIDDFKTINDCYGHNIGDKALEAIGKAIKLAIRKDDIAIRYGGDEFTVIFNDITFETAYGISDRIKNMLNNLQILSNEGEIVALSISIGLCSNKPKDSLEYLFKRADELLYKAKKSGKNALCYQD
jgi:two-component system cell cycle response regulator